MSLVGQYVLFGILEHWYGKIIERIDGHRYLLSIYSRDDYSHHGAKQIYHINQLQKSVFYDSHEQVKDILDSTDGFYQLTLEQKRKKELEADIAFERRMKI
jgi:hypothetical protein